MAEIDGETSLKQSIDLFKKTIADDMKRICEGKEDGLILLGSDKDQRVVTQLLKLVNNFDRTGIAPVYTTTTEATTITSETELPPVVAMFKPGDNPFEVVMQKVKASKNGNSKA